MNPSKRCLFISHLTAWKFVAKWKNSIIKLKNISIFLKFIDLLRNQTFLIHSEGKTLERYSSNWSQIDAFWEGVVLCKSVTISLLKSISLQTSEDLSPTFFHYTTTRVVDGPPSNQIDIRPIADPVDIKWPLTSIPSKSQADLLCWEGKGVSDFDCV